MLTSVQQREQPQLFLETPAASGFGEADIKQLGYELLGPRKQPLLAERLMKASASKYSTSDQGRRALPR